MLVFSWNRANVAHLAKHNVAPAEAERVVRHHDRGFPRKIGGGKFLVKGRTLYGRHLQVIYIYPADDKIDPDSLRLSDLLEYAAGRATVIYAIHAMDA